MKMIKRLKNKLIHKLVFYQDLGIKIILGERSPNVTIARFYYNELSYFFI
jgi:hypothetical protein